MTYDVRSPNFRLKLAAGERSDQSSAMRRVRPPQLSRPFGRQDTALRLVAGP